MHSDSAEPASSTRRKSRKSDARNNNLSEEQKRMNHIKSEKTRRDLIKIHEPNIPGYVEFEDEDSVQKVIALVGQGMTGF
ncbi:hypothetical protein LTR37_000042 [Vermiconidia calcicola]|uniref:Uncharacterized protein n=1 Tax=Vermiconidia calcicola TaxID=1690605 RepID=A0ACC3NZ93_9PEZI|nr:hypothetical protein LTR37_000042 [Vermiconidia calcicola]